MTSDRRCGLCRFSGMQPQFGEVQLVCRCNPPQVVPVQTAPGRMNMVSIYPVVDREQWCGRFETEAS